MKRPWLLPLSALALLAALPLAAHANTEVSASDLARHLNVQIWKFSKNDLPEYFSAALLEIKDGKVVNTYLGALSAREPGDVVIGMHQKEGKLVASIAIGDSSTRTNSDREKALKFSSFTLATKPKINEPLVLGANYHLTGGGTIVTGKVEDVESGIALFITPLNKEDLGPDTVSKIDITPTQKTQSDAKKMTSPDYRFHDLQPVIPVDNVDATVAYYRDKLGFKVDFVVGEPGIHARVSKDLVMLQFATRRPDAKDLVDGHYIHLGHVDGRADFDQLYKEYVEKGVKITMEPTLQTWGLREFEIEDLNGRRFRFAVDAPK